MKRLKKWVYETVMEPPPGYVLGDVVTSAILALIAFNVVVGMFETVEDLSLSYPGFFYWVEYVSVMVFTVEYVLRVWVCTEDPRYQGGVRGRLKYMLSPMAMVDLLAIAPFYLTAFLALDLRFVRVLRLFRLLRLFRASGLTESIDDLVQVVKLKQKELGVSTALLLLVVVLSGNLMFIVEHGEPETTFTSVPAALWWGMMTITTIGYGDMYPITPLGKLIGSVVGFLGICVFALPVGILGAGFTSYVEQQRLAKAAEDDDVCCPHCKVPLPEDLLEQIKRDDTAAS
jgi:voltage-gated potassium channel